MTRNHKSPLADPRYNAQATRLRSRPGRAPLGVCIANLLGVTVPFLGLVAGGVLLWGGMFSWLPLGLMMGMYAATGLGITVGYHRLFTHGSFETKPWIKSVIGVLGSMACEGPLINWVAQHRHHHQESDKLGDPHSPNLHGQGIGGLLRGVWHSHVGWVVSADEPNLARYVPDLLSSRSLKQVSRLFPLWVAVGLIIPTAIGWAVSGTLMGALLGFIWGGLVRIFLLHHVTWSINSICHLWGTQPFQTGDRSKNNFLFGVLALGEGWHNNHHAFPASARHGLRWWQIDVSYLAIRFLEQVGLAWDVKVPSRQLIAVKKRV